MTCEACRTIPPVVVEGYVEKGKWEIVGGLKTCMFRLPSPCFLFFSSLVTYFNPTIEPTQLTYQIDVTGPATATKALITVYDIFGPAPQTLQGADGLAIALGALVIVPDLLEGKYAQGAVCRPSPSLALSPSIFFLQSRLLSHGSSKILFETTGGERK